MSKGLSMERRALIAFVASMLLFLVYDALYLSPKMKAERERRQAAAVQQDAPAGSASTSADTLRADEPSTVLLQAAPGDSAAASDTTTAFTGAQTARTIVVASPLFELTLDTRGAVITSARLLRYETRGEAVQLLPPVDGVSRDFMLSATLDGETRDLPLSDVVFDVTAGGDPLPDGARVVVSGSEPTEVVFRATGPGGMVERSYVFYGDRYDFEARVRATEALAPGAQVAWSFGPGLASTEENVSNDQQAFRASVLLGEEYHRRKPGDFGRSHVEDYSGTLKSVSLQTKYFLAAMFPPEPTRAQVQVSGIKMEHRITQRVTVPAASARGELTSSMRVFLGPLDFKMIEALGVGLEKNVELGWNLIRPVSAAVLWSMQAVYKVIPNYGWVIIIISILTKVLFYRLTHKSFKSMKEMQDLQPKLAALKEKYGSDRRRMSEETMRLYKEAGVNPLGGCLPMLLQMPVFIALFNVLSYTIELRGAPFVGWISDLSQQDSLFKLPISLPLIGDSFSLLPILMGASMWAQSKLGGSPTGQGSPLPPGFNTLLPIVFTVLFYKMPSGLVIYWIINTVLSVAQQYYIVKDSRKPALEVVVPEAAPRKRGRGRKAR